MSDRPSKEEMELQRLMDALVDDTLSAPDQEILNDAREDGMDPAAIEQNMLALLDAAELKVGKARMEAAKAGAASARRVATGPSGARSVQLTAANDTTAARQLTMAARNGGKQSERDLEGIAEDLAELSAIPPDPEKEPK